LFICNGGYGSILLALSKGVPVLSAGVREGKNDINARVDYLGLGIDLKTERPTRDKIATGVARILGDRRFAQNVARIRAEFESYRPLELIDRFISDGDEVAAASIGLSQYRPAGVAAASVG
jgi:UDP:flavonoid glycosyltransferase YjiC (YdhE family)